MTVSCSVDDHMTEINGVSEALLHLRLIEYAGRIRLVIARELGGNALMWTIFVYPIERNTNHDKAQGDSL